MRRSANVEVFRQQIADLAIRSAVGAERALAIGDAALFDSYRTQFREQFPTRAGASTHGASEAMARPIRARRCRAARIFGPPGVEAACRHFETALAKGYGGAKFRVSQCVRKDDPARAAVLMREAADSGHPAAAELVGRACLEAKPLQAACAWDRLTVAAAAGRPSAQSVLAWMYAQGMGGKGSRPGARSRASTCRRRARATPRRRTTSASSTRPAAASRLTSSWRSTGTARRPRRDSRLPSSTWAGSMPLERGCRKGLRRSAQVAGAGRTRRRCGGPHTAGLDGQESRFKVNFLRKTLVC